jgi:hypothetical protein
VIDGNYTNTIATRLRTADTVVYLDVPSWLFMLRIAWRILINYGRVRADAAPGCPEWLDPTFLRTRIDRRRFRAALRCSVAWSITPPPRRSEPRQAPPLQLSSRSSHRAGAVMLPTYVAMRRTRRRLPAGGGGPFPGIPGNLRLARGESGNRRSSCLRHHSRSLNSFPLATTEGRRCPVALASGEGSRSVPQLRQWRWGGFTDAARPGLLKFWRRG